MSLRNESTMEKILSLVAQTQNGNEPPGTTDGIGNKGYYHWIHRTFRNAVIDALAMTLNDAAVKRFQAKYLQNHIMVPKEEGEAIIEIVSVLAEECKKRGIAIIGGETSYHEHSRELEINISLSGDEYLNRKSNKFEKGDCLIGIQSSGLMDNGFTTIRKIYGDEFRKEFVEPTFIYYDIIIDLLKRGFQINGMCHVTGSAFAKLGKLIDKDSDALIEQNPSLKPQNIFYEIKEKGKLTDDEMYRTFNCGIGFVLAVPERFAREIIFNFDSKGFKADIIGKVVSGNGNVRIQSAFSEREIVV